MESEGVVDLSEGTVAAFAWILRKTTTDLRENNRSLGRDLNSGPV